MAVIRAAVTGRRGFGRELTLATLSLFGLLSIVVLFALLISHDRGELEAATLARGRDQALMLSEQAARLLEEAEVSLAAVIEDAEPLDWNQVQGSRKLWTRISHNARTLAYVDAYWLWDGDGRLRLTSLAFPAPPLDASHLPFFQALRRGAPGAVVGHLLPGTPPVFRISRGLQTPAGGFAGIASVTIAADYFHRLYAGLPLPPGSVVILLRAQDLAPLVRTVIPGATAPPPLFDAAALRRALAANPQSATYRTGDYLVAVRAVPGFPLYVRIGIPLNSTRDEWTGRVAAQLLTAGLAVAALGLLTWAAFQQARRQRAFNDELAARVAERTHALATAKADLETVLQELHHRVNNNLQMIESLLTMQAARIREPEAKAALAPSIGRVHAIGLVHRTLYGTGGLAELRFGDYLTNLARHLADVYGVTAGEVRVTGANPVFNLETAVPLALIVHEVLANVLTHAYPHGGAAAEIAPHGGAAEIAPHGGAAAEIAIAAEPNHWRITVTDRGVGLPPGFDWTSSRGLGLAIVRSLAAQLGGEIEVVSGRGTCFVLRIPRRPGSSAPINA